MSSTQSSISTLFKSTDFWAINKKPGQHWNEVVTQGDPEWEPLHRLDFLTSGVLLLCHPKNIKLFRESIFKSEKTKKIYLAGASAKLSSLNLNHRIEGVIGSRYRSSKRTHFGLDKRDLRGFHNVQDVAHIVRPCLEAPSNHPFSGDLYEVELITGARHQIRSFFSWAKAPIVGDPTYEGRPAPRMELHAWKLEFFHPISKELISIVAHEI